MNENLRTGLSQHGGGSRADTGGGAGDQYLFASQIKHNNTSDFKKIRNTVSIPDFSYVK